MIANQCLDNADAPQIKYNFVTLDQMEALQKDALCGLSRLSRFV